jgi:FMN-dependent dehydrogenase
MSTSKTRAHSRRRFLRLLAASPLVPYLDVPAGWMARAQGAQQDNELIASAKDALNVFDFEALARKNLPPAHFGYMASGSDDDATIAANREGFTRYQLRTRRLIDVSRLDTSVQLFGAKLDNPILLPAGSGAARTSSRRSRWVRQRSASAGRTSGVSARLGRRGSRPSSTFCNGNFSSSCARRGPPRSSRSHERTSWTREYEDPLRVTWNHKNTKVSTEQNLRVRRALVVQRKRRDLDRRRSKK